ncbi:hypothetical protein [Rhodocista pekingensis]|uniref:hypothetical protein n=1 Tax=Rhodocista pekingensis TaxID=201185 RepID=UPI003A96C4F8
MQGKVEGRLKPSHVGGFIPAHAGEGRPAADGSHAEEYEGFTLPLRGGGGPFLVIAASAPNPYNILGHEAAHLNLREGRVDDGRYGRFFRQDAGWIDERYRLDEGLYPPRRLGEERYAHLAGEFIGGWAPVGDRGHAVGPQDLSPERLTPHRDLLEDLGSGRTGALAGRPAIRDAYIHEVTRGVGPDDPRLPTPGQVARLGLGLGVGRGVGSGDRPQFSITVGDPPAGADAEAVARLRAALAPVAGLIAPDVWSLETGLAGRPLNRETIVAMAPRDFLQLVPPRDREDGLAEGSSLHMQGKGDPAPGPPSRNGFIPAHAGEGPSCRYGPTRAWVHPCTCRGKRPSSV